MPPPLKRSSGIIGVLAVYLYELIEHTSCEVEVLVAEMLAQNQEDLSGVSIRFLHKTPTNTATPEYNAGKPYLWYTISIFIIPWYMCAISHKYITAF